MIIRNMHGTTFENVVQKLLSDVPIIIDWFRSYEMVVNPDKIQVMFLGCGDQTFTINIGNYCITSKKSVKLLGVTIDQNLTFNDHINDMCRRANQKISALLRIRSYISTERAKLLCNAYIMSSFNYCPLVWILFCSRGACLEINSTHQRALRAIHLDFHTPSSQLFGVYNETSVHTKNLRLLLVETFKSVRKLNPEFMWDLFKPAPVRYELRCGDILRLPDIPIQKGQNTLIFRAVMAWNHLPSHAKSVASLKEFRSVMGNTCSIYCQYRCCR